MRGFLVIWAGQVVSLLGTGMTSFALIIYAYELTESATVVALVGISAFAPAVVFSPVAGALVDRWNRKAVMALADLGAGASTAALLILLLTGQLQVWHLFPAVAVAGIFQAFHFPAFSAAITMMISKEHYARASGLVSTAGSLSAILSPLLAVSLLATVGLGWIFFFDIATVTAAVGTILLATVPPPPPIEEPEGTRSSLLRDTAFGFRYIARRRSLLGLQLVFFGVNLVASFAFILMTPYVLIRTDGNTLLLGIVATSGAAGQVAGGASLGIWGGPRRKIHGVLLGMAAASLAGPFILGVSTFWLIWAGANFTSGFLVIIINGSNQAIWQSKVQPALQGRVFAARRVVAQISAPIAMAAAGPSADLFFEPAMAVGGSLAPVFGWLVGTGPGSGIALMFVFAGLAGASIGIAGYAFKNVRQVENLLPDHDAQPSAGESDAA